MSLLKTVFKGFCVLLAVLCVLVIAVFGYNVYEVQRRSQAAREAAEAFCTAHAAGTPIDKALADATVQQVRAVPLTKGDGYDFEFMYFLDGWGCRLQTAAGTVREAHLVSVH